MQAGKPGGEDSDYDKYHKIILDVLNPSKEKDLTAKLYKDELPHETKQLKEFVNKTIKDMNNNNNSQDFNWVLGKKQNWFGMVRSG